MIRPFVILAAFAFAGPAFSQDEVVTDEAAPVVSVAPAITVAEVRMEFLRDRVIASGLVAAVEEVQVQPLIEGQSIEALLVDIGDSVFAGQVLARLSNDALDLQMSETAAQRASVAAGIAQAEASLIEATASADEATRVAARNDALVEQGTISRAAADQADAAADQARARVRVAEQGIASARAQEDLVEAQIATLDLQLARTEVKAPVAGMIVARNAQIGAIASAGGPAMFTIVRDGALEMRAEISEGDLLRLAPGQTVELSGINWPETVIGNVRLIEPTINTQSRLGMARISISDSSVVRVGMFLTAEILVVEGEGLAVPVTAVGTDPDGASVMRVVDGVVEEVSVTTGIRDGGLIGITTGLSLGDVIVTRAGSFVRSGDRITPVTAANEG